MTNVCGPVRPGRRGFRGPRAERPVPGGVSNLSHGRQIVREDPLRNRIPCAAAARAAAVLVPALLVLAGCEVRSFFDPSKTGRFNQTVTSIPILERIDVIEREEVPWARARPVEPEDLFPGDLTYRLAPGDLITVEVLDLLIEGQVSVSQRRIEANGNFRIPVLGDIRAAGLTVQEFQDELTRVVDERIIRNPLVNVLVEEGAGFQYTVYGGVPGQGVYALRRADLRLLDALAQAGGVALPDAKIYVIREVPLTERLKPRPPTPTGPTPGEEPPVSIEQLIEDLERQRREQQQPPGAGPPREPHGRVPGDIHPALFRQEQEQETPPIDIDDLEAAEPAPSAPQEPRPPSTAPPPGPEVPPPAGIEVLPPEPGGDRDIYIYVEERGEWVRVRREAPTGPGAAPPGPAEEVVLERIIQVPYARLRQGDSSYNIVIRPNDRIYVQDVATGFIYLDGEIFRPGAYSLPPTGDLTLSRLVASAGGLGPLAIPTRIDLTRMLGPDREATIRLNLAAIRNRTEPDIYLKPNDHIIVGTDFWATPLAVFRNGFRVTYGFGFLLDRNFGNDVFGPPPVNRLGQ